MKILLTGKNGQMNWELNRTLFTIGTVFFALAKKRDGLFQARNNGLCHSGYPAGYHYKCRRLHRRRQEEPEPELCAKLI